MITRMRELYGKIRGIGPVFFIQRSLQRLLGSRNFDLHWFAIYEQQAADLSTDVEDPAGRRWATRDDIDTANSLGYLPEACHRLFQNGARACVIEQDGRIVAHSWWETGTVDQQEVIFKLAPGEWWATSAGVVPEYRGQGLYKAMLVNAANDIVRQGDVKRFLGVIENLNRNPKHAAKKIRGARVLGTMLVVRLFGRFLIRDRAGLLIPADGLSRRSRWIVRRKKLEASIVQHEAHALED